MPPAPMFKFQYPLSQNVDLFGNQVVKAKVFKLSEVTKCCVQNS